MMTKSNFNQRTKLKILALVPVAVVLFLGIACVNGQNQSNVVAAVEPVRMNVLYIGVDNPIAIAVSGYETSDLDISVDNGKISGSNGAYIIRPDHIRLAKVTVSCKGKEIRKTSFRVKYVPDPVAGVQTYPGKANGYKREGNISKKDLLAAGGIIATIENFDFDMSFNIVSFVVSTTVPNSTKVIEEISQSDKFTDAQVKLIKSLAIHQKLSFESITVTGPDGMKRNLNPMVFTITE